MDCKTTINVIGAGRLGKTIAKIIHDNRLATLQAVCNTSLQSSRKAVAFIGAGEPCAALGALPPADITLISVPDDLIQTVCDALTQQCHPQKKQIVFHCSGTLSSDILASAHDQGCMTASLHPIHSFADPSLSINAFAGTYCALEGDPTACATLRDLFTQIGAIVFPIDKAKKACYHAAGVIACNYLVSLYDTAVNCFIDANMDKAQAIDITNNFMQGTLYNLTTLQDGKAALTGPIARGDVELIKKHLAGIVNADILDLYKSLGRHTINLTAHDDDTKSHLRQVLA